MLLTFNSPLRNLPASLDQKQALFFSGIRLSLDMIEQAYSHLEKLCQLLLLQETLENQSLQLASSYSAAWSLIDSMHRLQILLKQLPGFKQKSPPFQVLYRKMNDVENVRNLMQHLDKEITGLISSNSSLCGSLSWLHIKDTESGVVESCITTNGAQNNEMHEIINPIGMELRPPIDHITLTLGAQRVNFSEIYRAVADFVFKLESILAPQFQNHECGTNSWLIVATIELQLDKI